MTTDDLIGGDDRISAWLDGELDTADRDAVDGLRRDDPEWAEAIDAVGAVRDLLRNLPTAEPPEGFLDSLRGGVDDVNAPVPGSATTIDLDAARSRRHRRATSVVAGTCVAPLPGRCVTTRGAVVSTATVQN